jgi:hypothetical protein
MALLLDRHRSDNPNQKHESDQTEDWSGVSHIEVWTI